MTDPQNPQPKSTTAQKITAAAVTPVGIIALILLLPCIGCCLFGGISNLLGRS